MLTNLNNLLWIVVSILIFFSGLYFTFKTNFAQFNIKEMLKILKTKSDKDSVGPVESLMLNLAAKVGVGSITGIALAIYLGGPGTIFWMWITSIPASCNTFVESILSVIYREKDEGKIYKSGPYFYIEKGLKNKKLAKFYAIIILITFIGGFLTIQSNTLAVGITEQFNISPLLIGLVVSFITGLIIIKGVKSIVTVTNVLVPFMSIVYFIICFIIMALNINILPNIFITIVKDAFDLKTAGIGILSTFLIGMQRGIFSNEAGIGTSAIAAGASNTDAKTQGYIQTLGIHVDTLIIGTISAVVIMCSPYYNLNLPDANGVEIARFAFSYYLGNFGSVMLMIIIVLFAVATIISAYYFGESSVKFIKKENNSFQIKLLKLATIVLIVIGSVASSSFLWGFVDIFIGMLAIINIYAIWKLRKVVFKNIRK